MEGTEAKEPAEIATSEDLHQLYGEPKARARDKIMDHLNVHCRNFIALSPFCVLSTAGADGSCDGSPRGDGPGFAAVLDEKTLLLPDRPGNRRVDSFQNVLENGHAALLFLIPGVNETLRVNGKAKLV